MDLDRGADNRLISILYRNKITTRVFLKLAVQCLHCLTCIYCYTFLQNVETKKATEDLD